MSQHARQLSLSDKPVVSVAVKGTYATKGDDGQDAPEH